MGIAWVRAIVGRSAIPHSTLKWSMTETWSTRPAGPVPGSYGASSQHCTLAAVKQRPARRPPGMAYNTQQQQQLCAARISTESNSGSCLARLHASAHLRRDGASPAGRPAGQSGRRHDCWMGDWGPTPLVPHRGGQHVSCVHTHRVWSRCGQGPRAEPALLCTACGRLRP